MAMRPILAMPVLLSLLAGLAGAGARASDLRMTVEKPHFTCEGRGRLLLHASYAPGQEVPGDAPLPCCDGQIGCAQFLSTTTVIHTDRPQRG